MRITRATHNGGCELWKRNIFGEWKLNIRTNCLVEGHMKHCPNSPKRLLNFLIRVTDHQ
jgi:hypothetical protein